MSIFNWSNKKNNTNTNGSKKQLIVITGCAGSGKTTMGKELARQLGYAYIDKDTVTRDFTDYILVKSGSSRGDRESDLYRNDILPIEYKITFKLCREILSCGSNVVLTIPFIGQIKDWSKWLGIKNQAKIEDSIDVRFIWIKHDIDKEKKNIKKRNASRDEYKLSHWDEYAVSIDGIEPTEAYNAYVYVNDCDAKLSDTLEEVITWINK